MTVHFRNALRRLGKAPGFTVIAILMLGLGIGMSTATFSVANSVLLRSAPFPNGESLVRIFRTTPQSPTNWHSPANFFYLRSTATSFAEIADFSVSSTNITENDQPPEEQNGLSVTANFLGTLGIRPLLGRGFAPDEDQPAKGAVIVLTQSYWKQRFAGDPKIIGRTLRVDVDACTVIGVIPDFDSTSTWSHVTFVRPTTLWPSFQSAREAKWFDLIGRLKPGVTLAAAQAELSTLAARIDQDFPKDNGTDGFRAVPLATSDVDDHFRTFLWLTVGLACLVLLIACANLACLQLARAFSRNFELAVRTALGASRVDLMLPMLAESLMLTVLGGAAGILIGSWSNHLVSHYFWHDYPIHLDTRVLAFACLAAIGTGVVFGLVPAWLASRVSAGDALKENARGSTAARGSQRLKSLLIVGQLGSALVLISAALSFGIGVKQSLKRGLGWEPAHLFSGFLDINRETYKADTSKTEFLAELRRRLEQLPGVARVSIVSHEPILGYFGQERVVVEGYPPTLPGREPAAMAVSADPNYFPLLGIALKAGRSFSGHEKSVDPKVVVINETMARQFWPGVDPIGKRLRFAAEIEWNEVIGIVADVRMNPGFDPPYSRIQIYRPLPQAPSIHYTFILQSSLPAETLKLSTRKLVGKLDPNLIVHEAGGVEERLQEISSSYDLMIYALGGFATVGALIALLGLYAVISQLTLQRTREIGIRIALGASYSRVVRSILLQGSRLLVVGVGIGLFGAYSISQAFNHIMPELHQPGVEFEILLTVILSFAALFACYFPARRAGRIDPMIALRSE